MQLLSERGYAFSSTSEREIVRYIKEKFAYVTLNCQEELSTFNNSRSIEKIYFHEDLFTDDEVI